jgi:phage terminase large subunit
MNLESYYAVTNDRITGLNGSSFIFMGVRFNSDEIRSTEGLTHVWIEEAHNLTETSWDIIDPTIRTEGSEIWVTYNPRFKFDYIHKKFVINKPPPDSMVMQVNHGDNPYFTSVLEKQMAHMKEEDYEKYLHVWEGQIKQLADGAIFGKQVSKVKKDGRQCYIPVESNSEVHTFWDIGKNDSTSIWLMQQIGKEYRLIDYYENRLQEVSHYAKWIKDQDYIYGTHYMPHDADHDRLGMVRNIKEQFEDAGLRNIEIVERISHKATAIELARETFPRCWFHKSDDERGKRMERGWEALCNWRYKFKDEDDVFQLVPHHDWASNGADAFMAIGQGYEENSWGGYDRSTYDPNMFTRHVR